LKAVKQYFTDLLVGKDRYFIRGLCLVAKTAENEGRHDAQGIYCGISASEGGKFEISYRFAVKDEKGESMSAALVWNIFLTFENDVVQMLTPV
jgi:hypothetical protein